MLKNSLKSLPSAADWAERDKLKQMDLPQKPSCWRRMVPISYINEHCLLLPTQLLNVLKNVKEKLVKFTNHCCRVTAYSHYASCFYDMDMRKVIVSMLLNEHVDQGLSLTLFMRSDIPTGLYEWKRTNKKKHVTVPILHVTTPLAQRAW